MRVRLLIALILVAVACARPSVEEAAQPSPTPGGDVQAGVEASTAPPADDPTHGGGQGPASTAGPGSSPSMPQPTEAPPLPDADDRGGLGANALAYLRAAYPRMVIEVDAASGREPDPSTLEHLRSELGDVLSKPNGISVSVSSFRASADRYSIDDMRDLENRLRGTRTAGDTASLYVLFLNGRYDEDPRVLGLAYSASAFAIFKDAVVSTSSVLVPAPAIERAVTLHEVGHILRLVNIGYASPRDREDPNHPKHSSNRASVMYWAVESDLVSSLFNGPPPDTFDRDDRADLADLKAGRL